MNLIKETRFKCDFCGGGGAYALAVRLQEINTLILCADCAKGLHGAISKVIVPKSPENFILKKQKNGEETINEERL